MQVNRAVYRELADFGWNIHLVIPTEWPSGGSVRPAEPRAVDDPTLHAVQLMGQNPRSYRFEGLPDLIRTLSPSIVFADVDPVSRSAIELGGICRRAGIQLACLSCENQPFDALSVVRREGLRAIVSGSAKQFMGRWSRPGIDHVFTISSAGTRLFQQAGFRSVSQIPLGFSSQVFFPNPVRREEVRQRLGVSGIVLAYFGRMVPEKGIHLFLESLRAIRERSWFLLLDRFEAGQNSYLDQISRVTSEPWIRDRVRFIEADHAEIAEYMNAADIVVVPSVSTPKWKEQYGRVAPEAMACGCAVIASNSGTLPELVADAGIIFPEGNIDALSRAIQCLMNDPERIRLLGDRAAVHARTHLSIASQAREMNAVFQRLLSPKAELTLSR